MKTIVIDLDGTLTELESDDYKTARPRQEVIERLSEYKTLGFKIVIFTARGMRSHNGNVDEININVLPVIIEWLDKHKVPHDEVIVGKPWCGTEGFYVDDKAIRPEEFVQLSRKEITHLLSSD